MADGESFLHRFFRRPDGVRRPGLGTARCPDCGHPAQTLRFTAAGDRPRPVCLGCARDMDRDRELLRGAPPPFDFRRRP